MDPLLPTIILRGIERLAAVILSGLSVYYGYRLFLEAPNLNELEGKFEVKEKISIYLTKAGPGVFFALFGASVLAFSLHKPIEYKYKNQSESISYSGLTSSIQQAGRIPLQASNEEKLIQDRIRLRSSIVFLNSLPSRLETERSDENRRELTSTKLRLMKTVWGSDWGDFEEFEVWAESGATNPVPQELENAARYYLSGQEMAQ